MLPGDRIDNALPIYLTPFQTSGSTVGYTNDYDEVCPYTGSTSPDIVYAFTPYWEEWLDITLCYGSTYDTKLYIYRDEWTPGAPYACNDDACPNYESELDMVHMEVGHTYYIVIDGYGGAAGEYVIYIQPPVPGP
jgi:hypothetical protein